MKKLLGFLMVAGLAWFVIGCNSDPGTSVDPPVTEEEETEMLDQIDPASGAEEGGDVGDTGDAEPPAP